MRLEDVFNIKDENFTNVVINNDLISIEGESRNIAICRTVGGQLTWSDGEDINAIFKLQCCNDNENWIDFSCVDITTESGSAGINFDQPAFFYARIYLLIISGSVTINSAYISAKG